MKKLNLFSIILLLAMVVSCKHPKEVVYVDRNVEVTVTDTIHDTVFVTKADSSRFYADLVVDDKGMVSVTNTSSFNGDHLLAPAVKIKDNRLSIDCRAEAQKLFFQWKSHYVSTLKTQTIKEPVPYPVEVKAELTWIQHTFIWLGIIFTILLTIALAALIVRWRAKKL